MRKLVSIVCVFSLLLMLCPANIAESKTSLLETTNGKNESDPSTWEENAITVCQDWIYILVPLLDDGETLNYMDSKGVTHKLTKSMAIAEEGIYPGLSYLFPLDEALKVGSKVTIWKTKGSSIIGSKTSREVKLASRYLKISNRGDLIKGGRAIDLYLDYYGNFLVEGGHEFLLNDLYKNIELRWHVTVNGSEYVTPTKGTAQATVLFPPLNYGDNICAWVEYTTGDISEKIYHEVYTPPEVLNPTPPEITFERTGSESMTLAVGDRDGVLYNLSASDGSAVSVTWLSSNASVVVIDGEGMFKAVSLGKASVTGTTSPGEKSVTWNVIVNKKNHKGKYSGYVKVGKKESITSDISTIEGWERIKWTSSNKKILSVSGRTIKGKKKGKASISGRIGGIEYKIFVKVKK